MAGVRALAVAAVLAAVAAPVGTFTFVAPRVAPGDARSGVACCDAVRGCFTLGHMCPAAARRQWGCNGLMMVAIDPPIGNMGTHVWLRGRGQEEGGAEGVLDAATLSVAAGTQPTCGTESLEPAETPSSAWAEMLEEYSGDTSEIGGLCGRQGPHGQRQNLQRRRRGRRRRAFAGAQASEGSDSRRDRTMQTHRMGLAWGAGLETRNTSATFVAVRRQQRIEGQRQARGRLSTRTLHRESPRNGNAEGRARSLSVDTNKAVVHDAYTCLSDPYAWRQGVRRGEMRLLSDLQLLDFEGGICSFPLGGNRQRFDLSSLKERWVQNYEPLQLQLGTRAESLLCDGETVAASARSDSQAPREQSGPRTDDPAWEAPEGNEATAFTDRDDRRVWPLASLKSRFDEPVDGQVSKFLVRKSQKRGIK